MPPHRYRITIEGYLGGAGRTAFEEFNIACNDGHTSLVADLDQPGLYGTLIRIQSLGLELIELARIASQAASRTTAGAATRPRSASPRPSPEPDSCRTW